MKKYEYVTVKAEAKFFTITTKIIKHREVIDEYALKGFRYVGFIPTEQYANGIIEMDLIFEQDV